LTNYASNIENRQTNKQMTTYSLQSKYQKLFYRIIKELAMLFYLQIILFVLYGVNLSIEVTLFLMFFLLLSVKQKRICYSLNFSKETKELHIQYYKYIFFKRSKNVSFDNLKASFEMKRQNLGSVTRCLVIKEDKKYISEIRENGAYPWGEETLNEIEELNKTINK